MKLSTSEEYGLRCLIQVARRAPGAEGPPASIRDIAEAEGLSVDYAAKLLGALRKASLVTSSRGVNGGYRLARPAADITAREAMLALDGPFYGASFCSGHSGRLACCVHKDNDCTLTTLWSAVGTALDQVLGNITIADLLPPPVVAEVPEEAVHG